MFHCLTLRWACLPENILNNQQFGESAIGRVGKEGGSAVCTLDNCKMFFNLLLAWKTLFQLPHCVTNFLFFCIKMSQTCWRLKCSSAKKKILQLPRLRQESLVGSILYSLVFWHCQPSWRELEGSTHYKSSEHEGICQNIWNWPAWGNTQQYMIKRKWTDLLNVARLVKMARGAENRNFWMWSYYRVHPGIRITVSQGGGGGGLSTRNKDHLTWGGGYFGFFHCNWTRQLNS